MPLKLAKKTRFHKGRKIFKLFDTVIAAYETTLMHNCHRINKDWQQINICKIKVKEKRQN